MRKLVIAVILSIALLAVAMPVYANGGGATRVHQAIWVDGLLYGTVLTPTDLPQKGKFNKIYNFDNSGLMGQRAVADAKPGDKDYRGGRWEVYLVTFTEAGIAVHDPDGDGVVNFELMSDAEVLHHAMDLGHLVISGPVKWFVCPVIPEK
jgi:hypothetical protein